MAAEDIFGVIGDIGDTVTGIVDTVASARATSAQQDASRRQFDMSFQENMRKFGIEYALKEFGIRSELGFSRVANMFNRGITGLGTVESMKGAALNRRSLEQELAEGDRKKRVSQKFMSGFNEMLKQSTPGGRVAAPAQPQAPAAAGPGG